ncbi:MAG: class I SAM-dependent methyltransferase [Anaeroplasma bactoclasticum]|nr:class I SAM-dependent methyltransferase [Anaeroplasma bactoclasticum]
MTNKKYYEAYDERYQIAHQKGVSWSSNQHSPIVLEIIHKYNINCDHQMLEIGCGEGRDAQIILENGYALLATDISKEAITYCKTRFSHFKDHFEVLDCINDYHEKTYDFIYAVAVIHMLVLEKDRNAFYQFLFRHLNQNGIALICTMGDGKTEIESDINQAFTLQEREHEYGKMMVTATSCKMVSFDTFEKEISGNNLEIIEKGITSSMPDFNSLMFVVVKKKSR